MSMIWQNENLFYKFVSEIKKECNKRRCKDFFNYCKYEFTL